MKPLLKTVTVIVLLSISDITNADSWAFCVVEDYVSSSGGCISSDRVYSEIFRGLVDKDASYRSQFMRYIKLSVAEGHFGVHLRCFPPVSCIYKDTKQEAQRAFRDEWQQHSDYRTQTPWTPDPLNNCD